MQPCPSPPIGEEGWGHMTASPQPISGGGGEQPSWTLLPSAARPVAPMKTTGCLWGVSILFSVSFFPLQVSQAAPNFMGNAEFNDFHKIHKNHNLCRSLAITKNISKCQEAHSELNPFFKTYCLAPKRSVFQNGILVHHQTVRQTWLHKCKQ